ncbi:hypothetical protein ASG35_00525 [Burkholderia sp. Leaf177]|nr:hypothetical protein ASG35_00525 [Burkholderia sp. Leaf177]
MSGTRSAENTLRAKPRRLGFSRGFRTLCASQHRNIATCLDTASLVTDHSTTQRAIDRAQSVRSLPL